MASARYGGVVRQLHRLFDRGSVAGLAEAQLLERFVRQRDEAAFEALVARFGPMVLGVCRRLLDDPNDVDDAFQATFLILVKKAASVRRGDLLGNWLYGVAYRVAARARSRSILRRSRETPGAEEAAVDASRDGDRLELKSVLDEEIHRLPEKYRAPIMLCYLQGQTHEEAAQRLRWPVGTVRSRMAKARDLLRARLTRRGLALPAGLLGTALSAETASAAVPPVLMEATVRAAMRVAAGQAIAAGATSAGVAALAEGALRTMSLSNLKLAGAVVLAIGVASGGAVVVGQAGGGRGDDAPARAGSSRADSRADRLSRLQERLKAAQARYEDLAEQESAAVSEIATLKDQIVGLSQRARNAPAGGAAAGAPGAGRGEAAGDPAVGAAGGDAGYGPMVRGRASGRGGAPPSQGYDSRMAGMMGPGMGGVGGGRPAMSGMAGSAGGGSGMMPGMGAGGMGGMPAIGSMAGMGGEMAMRGRGMGGMMAGGAGVMPGVPMLSTDSMIVMSPPDSSRIVAYSTESGESKAYRVPKGTKAVPIVSGDVLALMLTGDRITQVAAFDPKTAEWYTQTLREPGQGQVQPVVGPIVAVYAVGHRVYAFSPTSHKWGVLELKEGSQPVPIVHSTFATVADGDRMYLFSPKTAQWTEIVAKDKGNAPDDEETKEEAGEKQR